jgi:signal transduction histidine kinase
LLKHEELNPPLAGNDEIAHLDHAFHDMARSLAELEQIKKDFVAMITHDLRTPMTSTMGFLELLGDGVYGPIPDKARDGANLAFRNVRRMIALINDLLDVEKLESGKWELSPESITLEPVVTRSVESVSVFAEQHKVKIAVEPIDSTVYADGNRLVQVLVNLITNAVKFSPVDSSVTISARTKGDLVELRITDQGCGIPPQYRESIFDRFRQVRATDATQKGGTGLGLAICKAIVEQHGGSIGVESEEGKGSTFWFTVPVRGSQPG